MKFDLILTDPSGETLALVYDQMANTLVGQDGERFPLTRVGMEYTDGVSFLPAKAFSPDNPARKSSDVKTLKIQLGLACNYSCSYCSQASQNTSAAQTGNDDIDPFIAQLRSSLTRTPDRIELWGGEPLVYIKKLRGLIPALRELYPNARVSMLTNGALLTDEIVDFLNTYDVHVTISHDGPGQALRGPDPLDDPEVLRVVRRLYDTHGVKFNMVLTQANKDPALAVAWLREKLERPVICNVESIVNVYHGQGGMTDADRLEIQNNIFSGMITGKLDDVPMLNWKLQDFLVGLAYHRPAAAHGQKCGMDQPETVAVDMAGNVLTCQNTGANGGHTIGSLNELPSAKLDTGVHWSRRAECRTCPVVRLCYGACLYLQGGEFYETCRNEYAANLGVLQAALFFITGKVLTSIQPQQQTVRPKKYVPLMVQRG